MHEKGGVLRDSGICRILLELQTQIESPRSNEGIRDNIQLSRNRQRAVAGNQKRPFFVFVTRRVRGDCVPQDSSKMAKGHSKPSQAYVRYSK